MNILIADAGATKTDWVKLSGTGIDDIKEETYTGIGLSPVHHDTEMLEEEIRMVRAALGDSFDRVHYFGTGVGSPVMANKMETVLSEMFDCTDITASSDMSGACIAVLGTMPGIACIMGTGSNSCHYNGEEIDRKSASLGYILDDDGGGVAFSRRLLGDVFKNIAPADIRRKFHHAYGLEVKDVVEHLYRKPSPNAWLAGFMPFIIENIDNLYIDNLIDEQLEHFFDREFCSYPDSELKEEGIGFVGSVASLFESRLRKKLAYRGWRCRNIIRKPMDSLKRILIAEIIR